MSLEAFISGQSVISSSGSFVPNTNPNANECRRSKENKLDRSQDDDDEEEDGKKVVMLAERTSQLMSSYKNYISGQEDEEMVMNRVYGDGGGSGGTVAAVRGGRGDRGISPRRSHSGSSNAGLNQESSLLREWNHQGRSSNDNNFTSHCELGMEELWDNQDEHGNYYNPSDLSSKDHRGHRYSHPIYHSKKFKRFMLSALVVGAVIGTVSLVLKEKMSESSLPDWDEELKEVLLEEEDNDREGEESNAGLMHHSIGLLKGPSAVKKVEENEIEHVGYPTVKDVEDHEVRDKDPPKEEENKEKEKDEIVEHEEIEVAESPAEVEDPEAQDLEIEPKKGKPAKDEEDSLENNPEGIGSLSGAGIEAITRHVLCCSVTPANTKTAQTATTGDRHIMEQNNSLPNIADQKYHIAESYRPRWYNRSNGWEGTTYAEALEFCTSQDKETGEDAITMLCPYEAYCPTGPHHIPLGGYRVEHDDDVEDGNSKGGFSSRSPISNDPNGWVQVGMQNVCVQYTILDMENNSDQVSSSSGSGKDDHSDDAKHIIDVILEEKETVVDVDEAAQKDEVNEGKKDGSSMNADKINDLNEQGLGLVEETYVPINISNVKPGPSSMTEELLAAKEKNEEHLSPYASKTKPHHEDEAEQESPNQEPAEQTKQESPESEIHSSSSQNTIITVITSQEHHQQQQAMTNILRQKFKPLWLSAKEGWNGGSHANAIEFCKSIRGKKLCPYSAICPHGPGNAVMGGRHHLEFDVTGEQYAPVMGGDNHWVMIGSSINNSNAEEDGGSTKCMTHRQLEGRAPRWGLSGDRAEVKQHIMCCTID